MNYRPDLGRAKKKGIERAQRQDGNGIVPRFGECAAGAPARGWRAEAGRASRQESHRNIS